MNGPNDELSGLAKAYRAAGPWLNASTKLTLAPLVGVGLGYWVDTKTGSSVPWGKLVGALVGMAAGFIGFVNDVLKMSKKTDEKKDETKK